MRYRKLGSCAPPRPGERNSRLGALSAEALKKAGDADAAVLWLNCGGDDRPRGALTFGDLYRLLPHRNEVCVLSVTREELEAFVIGHDRLVRKRGYPQLCFAAGMRIHRSGDGEVTRVDAPERLTLAVNDYLIADSPVLRPLAFEPKRRFRRLGRDEREVIAEYLTGHKSNHNTTTKKDPSK